MTAEQYKTARKERGTQQGVAALLGVDYHTIQRRESGKIKITREAEVALMSLRKKKRAPRRPNVPQMSLTARRNRGTGEKNDN